MAICSIDGCENKAFCRGWCSGHYHRWQRHGDPTAGYPERGFYLKWLKAHVVHEGDDCLIWPFFKTGDGRAGYLRHKGNQIGAARLMCLLVNGDPPEGKNHAAHSCGNGHLACVHPKHIRWASVKENHADRAKHGTLRNGESHYAAKLTERDVREIRRLAAEAIWPSKIAKVFGVSTSCVRSIVSKANWAHLG